MFRLINTFVPIKYIENTEVFIFTDNEDRRLFFQKRAETDEFDNYQFRVNYLKASERMRILSVIELSLRSLKMSFGFMNSFVLIVLIKPFQEPLLIVKTWICKQIGRK